MDYADIEELIAILGADFDKCYDSLLEDIQEGECVDGLTHADYEFSARQLVRAAFAYIEGVMFSIKLVAVSDAKMNNVKLLYPEVNYAFELADQIDDVGRIKQVDARISLVKNIRFAFSLYEKANRISDKFDASVTWWSDLKKAVKIRDRLTHPRSIDELGVTPSEVIIVISSVRGFEGRVQFYIDFNGNIH